MMAISRWGLEERNRWSLFKLSSVVILILLISAFHLWTSTEYRYLHEIYQRVYYIPILLAAFWFGPVGGLLAAAAVSIIYIFHIERDWSHFPVYSFNQYAEICLYHVVALIIGLLSFKQQRQRSELERKSVELSEAYEQLQTTFEQLRKADRLAALGELSAGIAHEIRNPLGSIKGSVEILEAEIPIDHPKHEFVEIIKEETGRLNLIVSEFLKFARPPRPSIQTASINSLIESTLILFKKEAQQSQIVVEKELSDEVPLLDLDPDQIRQVLLNCLLNALQAMPDGGLLRVKSGLQKSRGSVLVEIEDSGHGVSEAVLDQIFDPFYTTKADGTGLGLSISFQLVQNHRGRIWARRNRGKGLTVGIELPLSGSVLSAESGADQPSEHRA